MVTFDGRSKQMGICEHYETISRIAHDVKDRATSYYVENLYVIAEGNSGDNRYSISGVFGHKVDSQKFQKRLFHRLLKIGLEVSCIHIVCDHETEQNHRWKYKVKFDAQKAKVTTSRFTPGEIIGSRGNDWDGVFIEVIGIDHEKNTLRVKVKEVDDNWKAPDLNGFMPGEEFNLVPHEDWWLIDDHNQERKFPWFILNILEGKKCFMHYR